ncbi:MAG: hypothetical protein COB78_12950 [Hyphomicrobiales bacterium]|nr:MAG: hypothetical protein COB78_12950 [Hyphomicrobiales bacterium]
MDFPPAFPLTSKTSDPVFEYIDMISEPTRKQSTSHTTKETQVAVNSARRNAFCPSPGIQMSSTQIVTDRILTKQFIGLGQTDEFSIPQQFNG